MSFLREFDYNRVFSRMRQVASTRSGNEVIPITITVEPRAQPKIQRRESGRVDKVTVLATQDDEQRSIQWCELSSNSPSAVTNPISNDATEHQHDATDNTGASCSFSQPELQLHVESLGKMSPTRMNPLRTSDRVVFGIPTKFIKRSDQKPSSYIHTYIRVMYLLGTSAFHTNELTVVAGHRTCLYKLVSFIQQVFFTLVISMSAFEPFFQAKYNMLFFLSQGGLHRFVRVSFNITCLLTSGFGAYTLCHKWESIRNMVQCMNTYETSWTASARRPALCVMLAIVTVSFAILRSILIIDLDDFSVKDTVLVSSYQMSEDLFMWNSKNMNITTESLDNDFGTEINPTTIALSSIRIIRDFSFHLHHGMMWDLIATVVLTMFCWMKFFMKFVKEVVEDILDENSVEWNTLQAKRQAVWQMYRNIRCVFEAVNEVFCPVLLLFHITNVLRYAFFMEHLIYPEGITGFDYFYLLYNIVKSEIIYIVASHIESRNVVIRKVLRNWGSRTGKIDVGYSELDINTVLDELDHEPLGLGKGDFVIHKGFHFGLLGLVSSLFVMLASKKNA